MKLGKMVKVESEFALFLVRNENYQVFKLDVIYSPCSIGNVSNFKHLDQHCEIKYFFLPKVIGLGGAIVLFLYLIIKDCQFYLMLSAAIIKGAFHFDLIADIIESRYAKGKQTQNLTLIEKPFSPTFA